MYFEPTAYFFEVMRLKSVSKAAYHLGISQPALSQYLKTVEEKVGKKLYVYANKTIMLTPDGHEFANFLKDRLALEKSFLDRIRERTPEPQGKIVLGAPSEIIHSWLMDCISLYLKKHPKVRITVLTSDTPTPSTPPIDLLIAPKRTCLDVENIFLMKTEIKFFASPNYLRKFGAPQTLNDLPSHRFVCLSYDAKDIAMDFKWDPFLEVGSLTALKRAAENNIGIIALECHSKQTIFPNLMQVLPHFSPFKVDLYLIYLKRCKEHEPLKSLCNFLTLEMH